MDWQTILDAIFRWTHVIAAITWVGHAYFFNWLDASLQKPTTSNRDGVEGELWMVHSGGFYAVDKTLTAPKDKSRVLHWFKWEAAITWLAGFALLIVVYLLGGMVLSAEGMPFSKLESLGIILGVLVVGWAVYDVLWNTPVGNNMIVGALVSYGLLGAAAYGLNHFLHGRVAYILVGALLGTIMVANVWMRIIPAQRKMVAALEAGKAPDQTLAARAKKRSRHNNYLSVPVVFMMIASHYPTLSYGSEHPWITLGVVILAGTIVRHLMNLRHKAH